MVLIFESEEQMDDPEQVIPGIHLYFNEDHVFEE